MRKTKHEYDRKYYLNHKSEIIDYNRHWREKNREHVREYSRNYYKGHSEDINKSTMKWYEKNKVRQRELSRKRLSDKRQSLVDLLGTVCAQCGFADIRALQIDHINGCGKKERRRFKGSTSLYAYYLKHPDEAKEKLQVLCANCNWIKRHTDKECYKNKS